MCKTLYIHVIPIPNLSVSNNPPRSVVLLYGAWNNEVLIYFDWQLIVSVSNSEAFLGALRWSLSWLGSRSLLDMYCHTKAHQHSLPSNCELERERTAAIAASLQQNGMSHVCPSLCRSNIRPSQSEEYDNVFCLLCRYEALWNSFLSVF